MPLFVPEVQQFSSINTSLMVACFWMTSRAWKWLLLLFFFLSICAILELIFEERICQPLHLAVKWKFCLPEVHFRL